MNIRSSTILYTGHSNGVHGVAIALSPSACYSWEAAGTVFHPVSERIIRIRLKCHLSYFTVVAIYVPTNPSSSTTQAAAPSDTFYDQLQSVVSDVPPRDMLLVLGDFNARVGSIESSWSAFKSAINSACTVLPEILSSHDPDWVTDELWNLSQKKSNAWLSYCDAAKRDYEGKSHREEYKPFCKLTKEAAEKARNAWWTARAVEAERRALVAEQLGHGGSLIIHLPLDGSPSQLTQPSLQDRQSISPAMSTMVWRSVRPPLRTCQSSHHLFTVVNHLTLMTCVLHSPRRRSVLPSLN